MGRKNDTYSCESGRAVQAFVVVVVIIALGSLLMIATI